MVKDDRIKINPYGIVVNGEQMKVNYNELNSNGIMVNDEKYTKNIPIMPNKSKLNNNGNVVNGVKWWSISMNLI